MAKLYSIEDGGQFVGYAFDCPGCKLGHAVHICLHKNHLGASWDFDGNLNAPTFSPSIVSRVQAQHKVMICHVLVRLYPCTCWAEG